MKTLKITEDVHRRLKIFAAERGVNLYQAIDILLSCAEKKRNEQHDCIDSVVNHADHHT